MGAACVAFAARNLARKLTSIYDAQLEKAGISLPQFSLLNLVAVAGDSTLGQMAEIADLDPSTLTRNLQQLEKAGLIAIGASADDQRRRSAQLTEAGERTLTAAIPLWEAAQAEIAAKVGGDLRADLRRATNAL